MNWIQKACESMKTHPNNVGSNFNVADLSKLNHEKAYVTMTAGKGDYGIVREPCPVHLRNHDGGAFHLTDITLGDAPEYKLFSPNEKLRFDNAYRRFWLKRGYEPT